MELTPTQIRKYAELFPVPVGISLYGIYLGQQDKSMQDLAGIILSALGIIGGVCAISSYPLIAKIRTIDSSIFRVVWGGVGCIVAFGIILLFAFINE